MKVKTLVLGSLCLALTATIHAQVTPANPATKPAATKPAATKPAVAPAAARPAGGQPAAEGGTLSLGGTTSVRGGPILTRDELRACLTERDAIGKRQEVLDVQVAPLEAGRVAIDTDREAVRASREALDTRRTASTGLAERVREYGVRVTVLNKAVGDFNDSTPRPGPATDRKRADLDREQKELAALRDALEADRVVLTADAQTAVDGFNAKTQVLNARVDEWNQRRAQHHATRDKVKADDTDWLARCGDRRYREEDELAIRQSR